MRKMVPFMPGSNYVLITPAHNEAPVIEKTIQSVINQTWKPMCWVIVNDRSTDNTESIIEEYTRQYEFIQYVHLDGPGDRNFSAKVKAFNAGIPLLQELDYQFIGNLDADISFEPFYFEVLINRFHEHRTLGIAGGMIIEKIDGRLNFRRTSENSVAGAVQLFHRETFEKNGGYIPMPFGGIDAVAEIMARMHGWDVRTFPELKVIHYGPVVTGKGNVLSARITKGIRNYTLGYKFRFHIFVSLFHMLEKPYVIGGICILFGYIWAILKGIKQAVPSSVIEYFHAEQIQRLKLVLKGKLMILTIRDKRSPETAE